VPIDAFPDVSPTQVKIIVKAPGMTPAEVEQRITVPIELEVLGLPRQTMLRSVAKYALTDITLDFEMGTDIYWARQQVAERINNVWPDLPVDIEGGIAPMTTPLGEMFMFTLASDTVSLQERRRLLDWVIRPALRSVTGVADVIALGGYVRAFEVVPDPVRLAALAPALPAGVSVTVFYDRGNLVDRAIGTVSRALAEATVLVLILLIIFLGNLRPALTVALVLPLSVLATFEFIRQTGLSANLMSLGGLAIAIGILVDTAVVMVENIVSRLGDQQLAATRPSLHIVYRAASEVATPLFAGIVIIMVVFLPLLTLQGLEGLLFAPVAKTIVIALAAAGLLFGQIGKSFMPTMDEGDIIIQLEKIPSVSLEQSIAIDQQVQRALLAEVPEILRIVARAGSDEIGLDPMGLNETDSFLVLRPPDQWTTDSKEELIAKMRAVMDGFPGLAYGFTQPIEMRVSEMLTGVRGDVAVKLFGDDLDVLNIYAQKIVDAVAKIDGAVDVYTAQNEGRRVGIVREGVERTPLIVRGDGVDTRALGELMIALPDGHRVQLSTVARIEREAGLVKVEREQGSRFTVVRANVRERDLVGFVDEARAAVADTIALPEGYFVQWSGEYENQQRAARRLLIVVPLAIGLVFLVLFSTFGRVRYALLVLTNIPFAMIGGVFALYAAREYLSVPASVGFIALLGIAVLNGLVMLSHFNQLRTTGMPLLEAIREGSLRRLRPVLMTASIAALGLVPLLFASGPGSEIQRPLAIVVIGGLFSSTILTLLLLPILYRRFCGAIER
jgi:cobalt-zinc-cadmium resistance protein CzcA